MTSEFLEKNSMKMKIKVLGSILKNYTIMALKVFAEVEVLGKIIWRNII